MKLALTNNDIAKSPKKYVRLVITEDSKQTHRLVETKDGLLEYRMGIGKFKDMKSRNFITMIRSIVKAANGHQIEYLAIQLSNSSFPKLDTMPKGWVVSTIAENLTIANYEFTKYRTKPVKTKRLKEVLVCGGMNKTEKAAWKRGETLGKYVNHARNISNTTGDDMTPSTLAKTAQTLAKGTKVNVKVFGATEIKKKFPALWAVGKAADDLPRFIVMEYWGAGKPSKNSKDKKKQPLVLVGKGITYDSGGLNIKPSGAMHDMHMDMSGGSSVIASIVCAAKLGLKKNIVSIVPAAENAVSERSMRAGDIIQSHAGKTIEVLHTDAEGRLVLADGLSYAQEQYNPRAVLDVATLTGAALVALGQHASAIMTKDEKLQAKLLEYAEESGDYAWPLPLWDEYVPHLKSSRADIANIMPSFSRYGGTIEAGTFLAAFAPKCPWGHIDMAPRMESVPSDLLAKGSTGEPVRLLVKFLEQY